MEKITKGLISLVIASLLAGPLITVVAQMDESVATESVIEETPAEEINESVESIPGLPESAESIEDGLVEESDVESSEASVEEENLVTVTPVHLTIEHGIKADDLTLLKEGRADQWLIKLDWEKINPYLNQLDEVSRQEALDELKQSPMVLWVNGHEMTRVKLDQAGHAIFDISESLPKGTVLEFDIPEIKGEAFSLNFDSLELVIEGIEEELIVVEDALRPWDLAAIEAGQKGKWSIELVEERILDSIQAYTDIDKEQLMKLLAESEITMSVDGKEFSKLVVGEVGVATFDILEDLPADSLVTFSIEDLAWQEENGLEFKLAIAPLVVEVVKMEEQLMTTADFDVLSTATTEITMNAGEWINWNDLKFEDVGSGTRVTGTINIDAIYDKIKVLPNGSILFYPRTSREGTFKEIAKANMYIKMNGQVLNSENKVDYYSTNPDRLTFEVTLNRKIDSDDVVSFHLGPDANSGKVTVDRRYIALPNPWLAKIFYVHFTPFETSRLAGKHGNMNISSDAIIIDSPSPTLGTSTQSISGRIDSSILESNLVEIELLGITLKVSDILNSLTNALNGKEIILDIYDGSHVVETYSQSLNSDLEFNFDISDTNLKVGNRLVFTIDSFLLEVKVLGLISATLDSSISEKILYVEDIEISSVSPAIDFGSMEFSYQGVEDKAANNGMEIILTDNRSLAESKWQLSAQASGQALKGSIIEFNNANLESDKGLSDGVVSTLNLEVGEESQPFVQYKKPMTGGNVGIVQWTLSYAADDILLTIPPEVMMNLNASSYQADIAWTLTTGP